MSVRYGGIFFALAFAAHGQSIHDLFGTNQFHRAYFDGATHELTFEPFQELNWEVKARAALPWLNLDRPTPAQIARLATFESAGPQFRTIDFRASVDPLVGHAAYVLVSISAVTPIQPVQLKGSVNFNFEEGMSAVKDRAVSGTVVAKPATAVKTAAFVIASKASDVSDVHPAKFERKSSAAAIYELIDAARTVSWTPREQEQPVVASSLSFRVGGQQFLLVKWNSDVCASSYALFSLGAELKPIASNDYDCDP